MGLKSPMLVVMFIGAANADATPQQRLRLKAEALPPLRDETLTAAEAYVRAVKTTAEIMGSDWRPTGEWDETITAILGWGRS